MVKFSAPFLLLLAPLVASQVLPKNWPTAIIPAFTPLANLTIIYPKHTISNTNTGALIPLTDNQVEPTLHLEPALDGTYLYFMLDPDAPSPQQTYLANVLHQFKTGVTVAPTGTVQPGPTKTDASKYFGPSPPAGDAHRYTFIVFKQPESFKLPQGFNGENRIMFNLKTFAAQNGLGTPVAGQYFSSKR